MTPDEEKWATDIYAAIQHYTTDDERGAQSKRFEVGVSDLGFCSERTRRMLAQEDPDDTDMLPAFIGTAIGDHVEKAVQKKWGPDVLIQPKVVLTLPGSNGHTYSIPGHPDMVFPGEGVLIDGKTTRGLSLVRRIGPDRQKRFQTHGYAKAAYEDGLFGEMPLEDVRVGNVWIDRAGDDKELHVHLEPFDPDIIWEMAEWLDEVVYAYTHDEEARKEPPREMCAVVCGFFATCRAFDTDVEGLLTDRTVTEAIAQYREGLALEKAGARLKDQAKPALEGVSGWSLVEGERFALRWVHINATTIPEQERRAYDKIDLRKVK